MADVGRPSIFDWDIANVFLEQVATTTLSLKSICADESMPSVSSIFKYLKDNEEFAELYARAREAKAELLAEEILDIADDGSNDLMTIVKGDSSYDIENKEVTNRSKLRVDARKWLAAKMMPRKYGDKLDMTTGGDKIGSNIFKIQVVNPEKDEE